MFLRHKNLVKIKVKQLALSYSILVKLQPLYIVEKKFIDAVHLKNFSLGSCFFSKEIKESDSITCFTGIEKITALQKISKRKNKLSKVEEKDFELVNNLKKGGPEEVFLETVKNVLIKDANLAYEKVYNFLTGEKTGNYKPNCIDTDCDILIIGGGAVGLSIAYFIRNQFPHGPKVTVVDKDSSYPHVSTNLGQGLVSLQQFNDEDEILILKYGAEFFSAFTRNTEISKDINFKLNYDPLGSLLLVDESNIEQIMTNHEKLEKFGMNNNKMLDIKTLQRIFPWFNFENILFGSLGMFGEGIIDPWTYIYGLKSKCINLGVNFVTAEVIDFGFEFSSVRRAICKFPDGSYNFINFAYCVIAGGLESLNVVSLLNEAEEFSLKLKLPMEERMRYEYCFYNSNGPGLNTPIIYNSDGTYFRREGLSGHYVTGVSSVSCNDDDDVDENEESKPYYVFDNLVKPFLLKRMPDLKKIDLVSGWIDVYDFCAANKVGITGPHPCTPRIIFALGFSHFGLQYLPGLGRGVMEYLMYDTYQTINFEPFHIENLWRKQHLEADKKRRELLAADQRVTLSE